MKRMMVLIIVLLGGSLAAFVPKSATCARPLPSRAAHCREMEAAILAATVRLAIHGRIEVENGYDIRQISGTVSHATVVSGRYLITHNHFGLPLSQVLLYNQHANGGLSGASVYRLDGTLVLDHGPISAFRVVFEEGETVILDFGPDFFGRAGIPSIPVASGKAAGLTAGREVGIVDLDSQGHTCLVWTDVEAVYPAGDLTLMRTTHGIHVGASGGGVFLDGRHIGNNWGLVVRPAGGQGEMVERTLVAVNEPLPALGAE